MVKITNHTRGTMDFITAIKDGAAVTEHVDGGETKEIGLLNPDDPTVRGRVLAGAISVDGEAGSAAPAKQPAATDRRVIIPPAGE